MSLSKNVKDQKTQIYAYEDNLYFVDFNLPSGTKWCKYNLGVNLEHLEDSTKWQGDYYAWGELHTKRSYIWETYNWFVKRTTTNAILTKYNDKDSAKNKPDDISKLLNEDDVAYQKLHSNMFEFHMPTKSQYEELLKFTSSKWVNNYTGISELNGRLFTSGDKELFFPAVGYYYDSNVVDYNTKGRYWTSEVYPGYPSCAQYLDIGELGVHIVDYDRCYGFSIRPVAIDKSKIKLLY